MKQKVNQSEVVKILHRLKKKDLESGINFLDSRPSYGLSSPNVTSAGQNIRPKEMIKYLERNFCQSEGNYRIKEEKEFEQHRIELRRTNDNSTSPLYIQFYKKKN